MATATSMDLSRFSFGYLIAILAIKETKHGIKTRNGISTGSGFRDAKTAEEEQGINILYLALGFLNWFEAKDSAVKREAPLMLLPVELKRNLRTSTYNISVRDDEIVTNLPLQKRLLKDFDIELPEIEDDAESWSPSFCKAAAPEGMMLETNWKNALKGKGKWTVEVIKRTDDMSGFVALPCRWVVERTYACLGR